MKDSITITLSNGDTLNGYHWHEGDIKANLVIGTGMCETISRYEEFALYLNSLGIGVYGIDFLGQGLNVKSLDQLERWPANGFDLNVEGLHLAVELAKKEGLPVSVFAHSMGSFMVQRYIQKYPLEAPKAIICGTNGGQKCLMKIGYMLSKVLVNKKNWDKGSPILQNMGIGSYNKAIKNPRTEFDWLSYNEENVNRYIADPYCGAPATGGFWTGFLKGLAVIWKKKEMKKVSTSQKILLVAGDNDPVGRNGKGPSWLAEKYKKLGIIGTELVIFEHMRHEILNENERLKVYKTISDFILD